MDKNKKLAINVCSGRGNLKESFNDEEQVLFLANTVFVNDTLLCSLNAIA